MTVKGTRLILLQRLPYIAVSGAVFLLDRWTKILIENRFEVGESVRVIGSFFELTYVRNTGVAFGMYSGGDSSMRVAVLSGFAVAAALIVVIYSVRTPASFRAVQAALALVLGGAMGNLYDRLSYGYVVDFLNFFIGAYSWPTFNVADSAISVGVAVLAIGVIRDEIRSRA
jgi:signal peptidase II